MSHKCNMCIVPIVIKNSASCLNILVQSIYIAMLKHLFHTTFFVFQFESLQSQHEKLEKQAVTVQARLTNLQVCFIVTEVQPNTNA